MKEINLNEEDFTKKEKSDEFEKPPIFRTWKTFYGVVLGELLILIVLFYVFGSYFSF